MRRAPYKLILFFLLILIGACARPHGLRIAPDEVEEDEEQIIEASQIYRKSFAVVIGVGRYREQSIPSLPGAERDARHIASLLEEQGFEVTLLLNQEATERRIEEELGDHLPPRLRPDDRVFIYFAGHGQTVGSGENQLGYLVPWDGEIGSPTSTGISMAEMQRWFQLYEAKHVLFAADSCYSGLALRTRSMPLSPNTRHYLSLISRESARINLVAGTENQESVEYRGRGVFTFFLEEGIRGAADSDGNGLVTSYELHAYLQPRVAAEAIRQGYELLPQHERSGGRGEFVFFVHRGPSREDATTSPPDEELHTSAPLDEAAVDESLTPFQRAQARFEQARESEINGSDASNLYEESAQLFLETVDSQPQHPDAEHALNNAALAFEEIGRFESAMAVWRRLVDDYPESSFVDVARFRLAYNAYRFFEYEEAVTHFSIIARSSKNQDIRRDSILNTATILTNLEEYSKAAPYWRQYAQPGVAPDDQSRAEAGFRAAEMSYKRRDWRSTINDMKAYITEYRSLPESGPLRVRAAYYIAEAHQKLGNARDYYAALEDVILEFDLSGEKVGSSSAEYSAEARFKLVDRDIVELENFKIGGTSKQINQQIKNGARRVAEFEEAYKTVTAYRRPQWTVASLFRIGYVYELLAKAILESHPPTDTEQIIIDGLPQDVQSDLRRMATQKRRGLLQDQIDVVDQQWQVEMITRVTGMEDRAVAEYELCVRAAREGNIVNEYTRQAFVRLFAYRPDDYPLQREGITGLELGDGWPQTFDPTLPQEENEGPVEP